MLSQMLCVRRSIRWITSQPFVLPHPTTPRCANIREVVSTLQLQLVLYFLLDNLPDASVCDQFLYTAWLTFGWCGFVNKAICTRGLDAVA